MRKRVASAVRQNKPGGGNQAARATQLLFDAAWEGDVAKVQALLRQGADPNAENRDPDNYGQLSLDLATLAGHAEVVELLLKHGASPAAVNCQGDTILHRAAQHGRLDIARLLLQHGADANARARDGFTPLHCAATNGHVAVARLLLDSGANTAAASDRTWDAPYGACCPLHLAAFYGRTEIVELLLARGADVRAGGVRGFMPGVCSLTPLHYAAAGDGDGPQLVAAARALLDAGAPVDAAASDGSRPLQWAVRDSGAEMVALLLARGADANAADNRGARPLHFACGGVLRGDATRALACVPLLLDAGADANAPLPDTRETPLHLAATYARDDDGLAVVAELLQRGADVSAVDGRGRTPLHAACDTPQQLLPEVIELLLEHGADARAADSYGQQPLHRVAARWDAPEQCSEDEQLDDEWPEEVPDVMQVVRALHKGGADVDALDGEGRTPMMVAAAAGNGAACAALARRGARVGPPECSVAVQAAVVDMAAEAERLRRQQAIWKREREEWAEEAAALAHQHAVLEQERAAWKKERVAIEAARGSGGGGGAEQQDEEGQPAAKRKRGSAGAARRRR